VKVSIGEGKNKQAAICRSVLILAGVAHSTDASGDGSPVETLKLRHGEGREGGIGMLIDEDDVEILARLSLEFQ
jgi:hypothetical protein